MSDNNRTPPSADPASKPKQSRNKLTPEQRIARLEQKIAREKSNQRKASRKLQTRIKIILGAACLSLIDSLTTEQKRSFMGRLLTFLSERDRQALLDNGFLQESGSDTK